MTRTPNTISDAIENNSNPPAILNAGSVIDKHAQEPVAGKRRARQDGHGDQAGAQRDAAARFLRQAVGDRDEGRHQADRIDHDQDGDQRGDEEFERQGLQSDMAAMVAGSGRGWLAKGRKTNRGRCRALFRGPP